MITLTNAKGAYIFKMGAAELFVADGRIVGLRTRDISARTRGAGQIKALGIRDFVILESEDFIYALKTACALIGDAFHDLAKQPSLNLH